MSDRNLHAVCYDTIDRTAAVPQAAPVHAAAPQMPAW